MAQNQDQRRGVVVHNGCAFRVTEQSEIVLEVSRAPAARAASEVVFEIVVLRADHGRRFDRLRCKRGAAEIGVNDDAGGVEHWPDAGGI